MLNMAIKDVEILTVRLLFARWHQHLGFKNNRVWGLMVRLKAVRKCSKEGTSYSLVQTLLS